MNVTGKCPSCGKNVAVAFKAGQAQQKFGLNQQQIVAYVCSQCDAILGVETDSLALMTDLTERVAKRLGAPKAR